MEVCQKVTHFKFPAKASATAPWRTCAPLSLEGVSPLAYEAPSTRPSSI